MSKSGTKKKRRKRKGGKGRSGHGGHGGTGKPTGGVMGGMVSGFRRAVGAESKGKGNKRSGLDLVLTALLVAVAAGIIYWRFF